MGFLPGPLTLQSLFGKQRKILDSVSGNTIVTVNVIKTEDTKDRLTITSQPVQQGASISDHAFKEPVTLAMKIFQQNTSSLLNPTAALNSLVQTFSGAGSGGLDQLYLQFTNIQKSRVPLTVTTPKRVYLNMLIAEIDCHTDERTENILSLTLLFQEVNIVKIGTATVPPSQQRNPGSTQDTQNTGQKTPSFLRTLEKGVVPGVPGFSLP